MVCNDIDNNLDAVLVRRIAHRLKIGLCAEPSAAVGKIKRDRLVKLPPLALHVVPAGVKVLRLLYRGNLYARIARLRDCLQVRLDRTVRPVERMQNRPILRFFYKAIIRGGSTA